ncbi:MAG: hypothetical protein NUV74_04755 [Candidatus Brocadiaceae bacterium]|nr:hypothetical protein [Candidatus Brocadiaceae bacterium]
MADTKLLVSVDTKHLLVIEEIEIFIQESAGPNLTDFKTAKSFINSLVLRGEQKRDLTRQCLVSRFFDYL